ncbi:MAG: MBL fold metallo-hydrolase [bacterium]|nr:MBL fold metallo-hydrolase [bacterium]
MILTGYSKALYSTGIYYSPLKTLYEAGEGINTNMECRLVGIRNILLTHGHSDHYTGLINILVTKFRYFHSSREFIPLTIFYAEGDNSLEGFIQYIKKHYRLNKRSDFDITWVPLKPGTEEPLSSKRSTFVQTFATSHTSDVVSLGYNILEERAKLRPEFMGLSPSQIGRLVREKGKNTITYTSREMAVSYVGDCIPVDPSLIKGTRLLLHESTFLREEDKEENSHSSLPEVLSLAKKARVGSLILYHLSSRYREKEIRTTLRQFRHEMKCTFPIYYIVPGKTFILDDLDKPSFQRLKTDSRLRDYGCKKYGNK